MLCWALGVCWGGVTRGCTNKATAIFGGGSTELGATCFLVLLSDAF